MADKSVTHDHANDNPRSRDLVKNVDPDEWQKLDPREKAVCALAPLWSLSILLNELPDSAELTCDAARVLKALVDRATVILDVPDMGPLASVQEVRS